MGLLKDAFKWVVGLTDNRIDQIDVEALEQKVRGVKRLQVQWERDIKEAQKEYSDILNPEKNLNRGKLELRLALQKAKISAHRVKELTNAVTMLYRMSGLIENIKMLKKFHADLVEAGSIPGGMTIKDFIMAVDRMGGRIRDEMDKIDQVRQSFEDIDKVIERGVPETSSEGDEQIMQLLEKLQTLQAEGKGATPEADELKGKISAMYGLPA